MIYKVMSTLLDTLRNCISNMMQEDKLKHIVVSSIIAVVLNLFLPWWAAALITLGIGVAKEWHDERSGKGCAEWEDIAADLVGIFIGVL